jgi:hypothetical protein
MNIMSDDEIAFLERRASEELEMAQRATKKEVVAVHCRMADLYLERIADLRAASERPASSTSTDLNVAVE